MRPATSPCYKAMSSDRSSTTNCPGLPLIAPLEYRLRHHCPLQRSSGFPTVPWVSTLRTGLSHSSRSLKRSVCCLRKHPPLNSKACWVTHVSQPTTTMIQENDQYTVQRQEVTHKVLLSPGHTNRNIFKKPTSLSHFKLREYLKRNGRRQGAWDW